MPRSLKRKKEIEKFERLDYVLVSSSNRLPDLLLLLFLVRDPRSSQGNYSFIQRRFIVFEFKTLRKTK